MGAVSQLLARHNVEVRRGRVGDHRDQGIVERWNRTLSERLFGHEYAQEMRLPVGGRSTEWVQRLPAVVSALNGEVTRLTGKRPSEAIRAKSVSGEPFYGSRPPCRSSRAEAPFWGWCSLPLSARRTRGWAASRH